LHHVEPNNEAPAGTSLNRARSSAVSALPLRPGDEPSWSARGMTQVATHDRMRGCCH
jgi:hypothetical protein